MKLKLVLTVLLCMTVSSAMAHGSKLRLEKEEQARKERLARLAQARARYLASIPARNAFQEQRFALIVDRGRAVGAPSRRHKEAGLGAAAALYTSLNYYSPRIPFSAFVQQGREQRWLPAGAEAADMGAAGLARGLQSLKLLSEESAESSPEARAMAAIRATLSHRVAFFEVSARDSYQAITEKAPPAAIQGRLVVSMTAVLLDEQGHVQKVGLYDANVYNAKTPRQSVLRYISYPQLLALMTSSTETRMPSVVTTTYPMWERILASAAAPQ